MSNLEIVNRFFFQWLFVRLSKHVEKGILKHWLLTAFVLPLTGLAAPYQGIGKVRVYSLGDQKIRRRLLNDPLWVIYPLLILLAVIEKFEILPELAGVVSAVLGFACVFLFLILTLFAITDRQVGGVDGLPRKLKWVTDGSKPPRGEDHTWRSLDYILAKDGAFGRGYFDYNARRWIVEMSLVGGDRKATFKEVDAWTTF